MFYVYVIKNKLERMYIGQTSNLELRVKRHNDELPHSDKSFTHKIKGPWEIVYSEEVETRVEALKREKQLKSYQGRQFIRKILNRSTPL